MGIKTSLPGQGNCGVKRSAVKRITVYTVVIWLLCLGTTPLQAQVRIAMPVITGLICEDGQGLYQQILREAASRAGLVYYTMVFPQKRALLVFKKDTSWDGIFTFTDTVRAYFPGETILATYPFGAYLGYIFTHRGTRALTTAEDLRNLTVGGIRGFEGTWPQFTAAGIAIELVDTDAQNLAKLKAGRIQAFLGFLPDLHDSLEELSYDPDKPFFQSYDRLNGRDTPAMREFLERLDPILRMMHKDGTIRRIMGTSYSPVTGNFPLEN